MNCIELIGTTGAGKSTLLGFLLHACRAQGMKASLGEDYVLEKAHLGWLRGYLLRTLFIDVFSISSSIRAWRKHTGFYKLVFRLMFRLKKTGWLEKLNILRNTFKKVGIHEILQHASQEQQIVFLDEGTVHTAHYLFVHLSAEFEDADLADFISHVPLPNVLIYLRQKEDVLVERTLARGHKRIQDGSRSMTERFIQRAVTVFDKLTQAPAIVSRLLIVDSDHHIQIPQAEQNSPAYTNALAILEAALALANDHSVTIEVQPALGYK